MASFLYSSTFLLAYWCFPEVPPALPIIKGINLQCFPCPSMNSSFTSLRTGSSNHYPNLLGNTIAWSALMAVCPECWQPIVNHKQSEGCPSFKVETWLSDTGGYKFCDRNTLWILISIMLELILLILVTAAWCCWKCVGPILFCVEPWGHSIMSPLRTKRLVYYPRNQGIFQHSNAEFSLFPTKIDRVFSCSNGSQLVLGSKFNGILLKLFHA